MCHRGRDLSVPTEWVSVFLSSLPPDLHHPGPMLPSLTCIPHISPLGKSQALSSFSLGVKVGVSASLGDFGLCIQYDDEAEDGKSLEIISQAAAGGGMMGMPLGAASIG